MTNQGNYTKVVFVDRMSNLSDRYPVDMHPILLQMVSNGGEGWRASGTYDPSASVSSPHLNWMNSGMKGTNGKYCVADLFSRQLPCYLAHHIEAQKSEPFMTTCSTAMYIILMH